MINKLIHYLHFSAQKLIIVMLIFFSSKTLAVEYTISNLSPLIPNSVYVRSINNNQQILLSRGNGANSSYIYKKNNTLIEVPYEEIVQVTSLNNRGQITGRAYTGGAVIYNNANYIHLDITSGYSIASSINDNGVITGYFSNANSDLVGFIYKNGVFSVIESLGNDNTYARHINNNDQVIGDYIQGNQSFAFLYENGEMKNIGVLEDNPLGAGSIEFPASSEVAAMNDNGQIVGSSAVSSEFLSGYSQHAFLYENNTMTDLGTFGGEFEGSRARDINNNGTIVGFAENIDLEHRAFLYENGELKDLCVLVNCISNGWSYLSDAISINDNGDIIGYGFHNVNGSSQFIISPIASTNGDMNVDGTVNSIDVLIAQQILNDPSLLTADMLLRGDLAPLVNGLPNGDGEFTTGDLFLIQQKSLGIIDL